MPKIVGISIYNIGRSGIDIAETSKWLDEIGATRAGFRLPPESEVTDGACITSLAAKRCYMSFAPGLNPNVEKVRTDYVAYLDNILKSGHGSVLEHVTYIYAIEGVSRVFTAEMNRHRAGWAVSEGSMRYIKFDEIPFWMPASLYPDAGDDQETQVRKWRSRDLFNKAFLQMEENYAEFMRIWGDGDFKHKKRITSAARRLVGMGVATGGVWTGNIRAIRHVLALRTDPSAEEEIFHVMRMIGDDIIRREPMLFQDFRTDEEIGALVPAYRKV